MSAVGFIDDAVLFSPTIPQAVNALLQSAVVKSRSDKLAAEQLFLKAKAADKHCLQTYFALYKFYFYQARLSEAEQCVDEALNEAAKQGEIPNDPQQLYAHDMYANEARLFYLYTLKARAFIQLRLNQLALAETLLSVIRKLDPQDRSGASVIMQLSQAMRGEDDE